MICLGESEYFRYNCPNSETKLNDKECKQRNSLSVIEKSTRRDPSPKLIEKNSTETNQLKGILSSPFL